MNRFLPLALLPLLAACVPANLSGLGLPGTTPPEPVAPVLPPQVMAALPPGAPTNVVFQNSDGCYLISIEVTEPRSGYPVRDAAGNPICEGDVPAAF